MRAVIRSCCHIGTIGRSRAEVIVQCVVALMERCKTSWCWPNISWWTSGPRGACTFRRYPTRSLRPSAPADQLVAPAPSDKTPTSGGCLLLQADRIVCRELKRSGTSSCYSVPILSRYSYLTRSWAACWSSVRPPLPWARDRSPCIWPKIFNSGKVECSSSPSTCHKPCLD